MFKKVRADKLTVGMVSEDWDTAGLKVVSNELIERPTMKYNLHKITLSDGTSFKLTPVTCMNVRNT